MSTLNNVLILATMFISVIFGGVVKGNLMLALIGVCVAVLIAVTETNRRLAEIKKEMEK